MLHFKVTGDGAPLVLLHGLFGSLENLGAVARFLSVDFKVYSIDLPNHGRSPHEEGMDLPQMARVVGKWLVSLGLGRAALIGHSLGGKVAMEIALAHPELVDALAVIDIAPVQYPPRHDDVFAGLAAILPSSLLNRAEADAVLEPFVPELAVRSFLLKNLVKDESGFHWRMNLGDLQREYRGLIQANRAGTFSQPVLFLKGGESDYIRAEHRNGILQRFPHAQLKIIPGVGHWLHAEKPELTATLLKRFLLHRDAACAATE